MPMERPREQGRGGVEAGEATSPLERGVGAGLRLTRHFVPEGANPYDEVEWDVRSAVIHGDGGKTVFEQRDVEVPRSCVQLASNALVSKDFLGPIGTPKREHIVHIL